MPKLTVHPPAALDADNPPALEQFQWRFLADGDSWFTIGTLNLLANSNLLFELSLSRSAIAINCGYPGDVLSHMVDRARSEIQTCSSVPRASRGTRCWSPAAATT